MHKPQTSARPVLFLAFLLLCMLTLVSCTPYIVDPEQPGSSTETLSLSQTQHLLNHPVSSSTSGKAPTNRTLSKPASANGAIYGVTIGEDSDDPCYMAIKYRNVATRATQSSLQFSECDGHKIGDLLTASLPVGAFTTGVRICLNAGGDKLKGIQLIGGYDACVLGAQSVSGVPSSCSTVINISGHDYRLCNTGGTSTVTVSCSVPVTSFVERPNCRGTRHDLPDADWETLVSCPARMVATGMKLRTIAGSGQRKMIDGVALVCDTLVP